MVFIEAFLEKHGKVIEKDIPYKLYFPCQKDGKQYPVRAKGQKSGKTSLYELQRLFEGRPSNLECWTFQLEYTDIYVLDIDNITGYDKDHFKKTPATSEEVLKFHTDMCEKFAFLSEVPYTLSSGKNLFHYYFKINGIKNYKNQIDIFNSNIYNGDLLHTNCVKEKKYTQFHNSDLLCNIPTFRWDDIKQYFKVDKMNFEGECKKSSKVYDKCQLAEVEKILIEIIKLNQSEYSNYNSWIRLAFMLKNEFGEEAWDCFDRISKLSSDDNYDKEANREAWDRISDNYDNPITVGSLFYRASQLNIKRVKDTLNGDDPFKSWSNQEMADLFYYYYACENVKVCGDKSNIIYLYNDNNALWEQVPTYNFVMSNFKEVMEDNLFKELKINWIKQIQDINKKIEDLVDDEDEDDKEKKQEIKKLEKTKKIVMTKIEALHKQVKNSGETKTHKSVWDQLTTKCYDAKFEDKINNKIDFLPIEGRKNINLQTKELVERTQTDYFTYETKDKILSNPDYTNVQTYMNNMFVDKDGNTNHELINYIQVLSGYLLSGRNDRKEFYNFHGIGNNGKSVFVNLLQKCLGEYGKTINERVIIKGSNSSTEPELLKLRYLRTAFSNELDKKEELNSKNIKKITGRDKLEFRALFVNSSGGFITKSKLVIASNYKQVFDANDEAMVNRIIFIPFYKRFPKPTTQEQLNFIKLFDPAENEEQYNDFFYQFFNWILDGSVKSYNPENWIIPQECIDAKREYVEENDIIHQFFEDVYIPIDFEQWKLENPNFTKQQKFKECGIKLKDVWNEFQYWTKNEDLEYKGKRKDFQEQVERKYTVDKNSTDKIDYVFYIKKKPYNEILQDE